MFGCHSGGSPRGPWRCERVGGSYLNIQSVFPPSIVVVDSPSGGTRLINNDKRRKNNSLEEMRNLPARGNQGERDDKSCYRFLDDRPLFLYLLLLLFFRIPRHNLSAWAAQRRIFGPSSLKFQLTIIVVLLRNKLTFETNQVIARITRITNDSIHLFEFYFWIEFTTTRSVQFPLPRRKMSRDYLLQLPAVHYLHTTSDSSSAI